MIKWSAVGLLLLITESTPLGCDNCKECETCIDQMCFSACRNMTGAGACDCYGDICFDKDWCNIYDEVCCRTCENNWTAVIAIIVGLVGSIFLVVFYNEFSMLNHIEERVEVKHNEHKLQEEDKAKRWPKVEIIGMSESRSSSESVDDDTMEASFGALPRLSDEAEIKNSYHGAWSRTSREVQMKTKFVLDFHKMSFEAEVHNASSSTLPSHSSEGKLSISLDDLLSDICTTLHTVPGVDEEANDADTLRFVHIPGLVSRVGFSKADLSSQHKTDERLHLPSPYKSKNARDMWTGYRKQSNWDAFFESHSTLMCTRRTEHTVTTGPNSSEWMDWEKTDRDASLFEIDEKSSCENSPRAEILRKKGEILLSYWSKGGLRFTFVPLDMQLEDVASWLNKHSAHSIPISQNTHQRILKPEFRAKPCGQTIADIFGGDLDPEKDGITCFIGPIDGRISFKMSKCELDQLEKATRDSLAVPSPIASKKSIEFVK